MKTCHCVLPALSQLLFAPNTAVKFLNKNASARACAHMDTPLKNKQNVRTV